MIALAVWLVSLIVVAYAALVAVYLAAFVVLGAALIVGAPVGLLIVGFQSLIDHHAARRRRPLAPPRDPDQEAIDRFAARLSARRSVVSAPPPARLPYRALRAPLP